MFLEFSNDIRIAIADFLNIVLIDNNYVFVNLWSFVHLTTGFIIMYLLIKKFRMSFWKSFSILMPAILLWELFEFMFYSNSISLFKPESTIDIIWDLVQGMIGGALCFWMNGKKSENGRNK